MINVCVRWTAWVFGVLQMSGLRVYFVHRLTHHHPHPLPGIIDRHFADDIFRRISVNEKFGIWLKSTDVVQKGPIDSIDLDNGFVLNRRRAIILTNIDPRHWRIYVSWPGQPCLKHTVLYRCCMKIVISIKSGYHANQCPTC